MNCFSSAGRRSRSVCATVHLSAALALSCGAGGRPASSPSIQAVSGNQLSAADVQRVIAEAAQAADQSYTIAVTDRGGRLLAVYSKTGAPQALPANFGAVADSSEVALALARTAAFFSNNQAPLSSRTVRYISGIHFPPGIADAPSAALYGIENTNRGCPLNASFLSGQSISAARSLDGSKIGLGPITGKADLFDSDSNAVNPGGVPLFRNGELVGGVGVAAARPDVAEFASFSAAVNAGFGSSPARPGVVVIDGVSLPFVNQTTRPVDVGPGQMSGTFIIAPSAGSGVPDGDLIAIAAGSGGLSQQDVQQILDKGVATANVTRAVIRLPEGERARFVIAIVDLDGHLLGLRRMPDTTVFSIDVAVAKARNMVYFNTPNGAVADLPEVPVGTIVSNRTIGFAGQPLFPSGINGSSPGPLFPLYLYDTANPCTNGHQTADPNQNGVVFFPGSVPLYKNGVLVGGLGVSGDGVDQDDYVSAQAAAGFEAPTDKTADNVVVRGVRLPYLKFPRNPTQ